MQPCHVFSQKASEVQAFMFGSFKFYFLCVSVYMYMFMCTRVPTDSKRGCPVDSLLLAIEHGCWEPNSGCLEAGAPDCICGIVFEIFKKFNIPSI